MKNRMDRRYVGLYSLVFALMGTVIFSFFWLNGRTFVWRSDGWIQQIRALIYTSQSMRDSLRALLTEQRFYFPQWDFAFGEGSDTLSPIQFYAFGDPFNLLSVLVPMRWMHFYYDAMVILRVYCAGLAFSALCFELQSSTRKAVLAGAMSYCFCFWVLMFAGRHPFFINNLIFLPLLILGIERVLTGRRAAVLALAVCGSALSMFSFFYVLALLTVIYFAVRSVGLLRKNPRGWTRAFLTTAGMSLLGVMMAGWIAVPMMNILLGDQRLGLDLKIPLFYPLSHYTQLFGNLLSQMADNDHWMSLGFSSVGFFALGLLCRKRRERPALFCFLILCLLMTVFPFLGHVLNCFSYVSCRWSFAFALLSAYSVTLFWQRLIELTEEERRFLIRLAAVWSCLCLLFRDSRKREVILSLGILWILLIAWKRITLSQWRERALFTVLAVGLFINAAGYYTGHGTVEQNKLRAYFFNGFFTNETEEILSAAKESEVTDFYRYSGRDLSHNAGLLRHLSSTNYVWSLTNPALIEFGEEMAVNEPIPQIMTGYNERASILAMSGVRFYALPYGGTVPYGFTQAENHPIIYENANALPLGFSYNQRISAEQWAGLNPIQKQEALLKAVYLPDSPDEAEGTIPLETENLDFSVNAGDGVDFAEGIFTVRQAGAKAEFQFQGIPDAETALYVRGLDYERRPRLEGMSAAVFRELPFQQKWELIREKLFWKNPWSVTLRVRCGDHEAVIPYNTRDHMYYSGRHDFVANLGWQADVPTSVTVTFPQPGVYRYNGLSLLAQPMDGFGEVISQRRESVLENVEIKENQVSGSIRMEEPAFLMLSIPYHKGWRATVDGAEVPLLRANLKYMALALPAGDHSVRLDFHIPYFVAGIFLSLAGWGMFGVYLLRRRNGISADVP